jgi:hypothetical protein
VTIYSGSQQLAQASIQAGSIGNLIPFSLANLTTSNTTVPITCQASVDGQTYYANNTFLYLPPNPYGSSVVKIDRRSGGLMVRNFTTQSQTWEPFFPFGFYDLYNTSIVDNVSFLIAVAARLAEVGRLTTTLSAACTKQRSSGSTSYTRSSRAGRPPLTLTGLA